MENTKTNFNELTDQEIKEVNGGSIMPTPDMSNWYHFWEGVGMKIYDVTHKN
jgi:hypothetical protein